MRKSTGVNELNVGAPFAVFGMRLKVPHPTPGVWYRRKLSASPTLQQRFTLSSHARTCTPTLLTSQPGP